MIQTHKDKPFRIMTAKEMCMIPEAPMLVIHEFVRMILKQQQECDCPYCALDKALNRKRRQHKQKGDDETSAFAD